MCRSAFRSRKKATHMYCVSRICEADHWTAHYSWNDKHSSVCQQFWLGKEGGATHVYLVFEGGEVSDDAEILLCTKKL